MSDYPTDDLIMVALATPDTYEVLQDVADERVAQVEKWGEQNHPDGTGRPASAELAEFYKVACDRAAADGELTWAHILREEVYEALAESDPVKLYVELVQVAAVAVAWAEAIDRRQS